MPNKGNERPQQQVEGKNSIKFIGARALLGAPGLTTSNKDTFLASLLGARTLLGAPSNTNSNSRTLLGVPHYWTKDTTRRSWPYF